MGSCMQEELAVALLYYSQCCTGQDLPGAGEVNSLREEAVQGRRPRRPRKRNEKDTAGVQENEDQETDAKVSLGRLKAPKTHLTALIAARRRDPAPSDKSRVFAALAALQNG